MKKPVVIQFMKRFAKVGAISALVGFAVLFFIPYVNYVNDFAGILSSDTEKYIESTSTRISKKFGARIVVAATKSWDAEYSEGYLFVERAEKWWCDTSNIKTQKNLLILVSEKEREVRISTGVGFDDGRIDDTVWDEMIRKSSELVKKDLDAGTKMVFDLWVKELGLSLDDAPDPFLDRKVVGVVLLAAVLLSVSKRNRNRNSQKSRNDVYVPKNYMRENPKPFDDGKF
ncbi:hypothetical protein FACS189481_2620 [Clostridia bacterium]|nr:hypothetical protein FACS189481_2620 [Clostridia bacterium]